MFRQHKHARDRISQSLGQIGRITDLNVYYFLYFLTTVPSLVYMQSAMGKHKHADKEKHTMARTLAEVPGMQSGNSNANRNRLRPTTVTIPLQLRFPPALHAQVKARADLDFLPVAAWIRQACLLALRKRNLAD
jgi:hypothetical protein